MSSIAQRLELKGQRFVVGEAASQTNIEDVWSQLVDIDPEFSLSSDDKITRKNLTSRLQSFMKHCCCERHYFFDIKKCGDSECSICKPPRLASDVFLKLNHFPDPMPADDGHYKRFEDVFGSVTVENHRPSLQTITKKRPPFSPSIQHVKRC